MRKIITVLAAAAVGAGFGLTSGRLTYSAPMPTAVRR